MFSSGMSTMAVRLLLSRFWRIVLQIDVMKTASAMVSDWVIRQ